MDVGYYGSDRNHRLVRERIQQRWMDAYAPVRHLDPTLVAAMLALTGIGVLMIYSATAPRLELSDLSTSYYATRQLVNVGVAAVGFVLAAVIDYRQGRTYAGFIYAGCILLLLLLLTPLGAVVSGSRSWLDFGGFRLQPSELAKVGAILAAGAVLHERKGSPGLLSVGAVLAVFAVPAALVLMESDLGTALVFPVVAIVLLVVGGTKGRHLLGLAVVAALGAAAVFQFGVVELEPYQVDRLTAFISPAEADPQSSLWNAQQSMIAIGSGGFAGKGLFQGTQTNLAYVPENHTDFIMTVVGEEFGFLGMAVVLGLFAVILWRGLRIAALAKDLFGTLIAVGAVTVFAVQMFVNVGMTVGIAPITGLPLPFVSYGGTSLLSAWVLVGLMLNVHMRRF